MTKRSKLQLKSKNEYLNEITNEYSNIKSDISTRLAEFEQMGLHGSDLDLFCELAFCLFTPQSKAKSCSEAVSRLLDKDLILSGSPEQLSDELNIVRFKYTKAKNLIAARDLFIDSGELSFKKKLEKFQSPFEIRDWLVDNVKGMGYKEASHFLRNIGMGEKLAILDRHILKNLTQLGVIDDVPSSITPKKYMEIEKKLLSFAYEIKIPAEHLDLLLWYKQTGEIFK
jgi:N-glycosylase/DNA lyase